MSLYILLCSSVFISGDFHFSSFINSLSGDISSREIFFADDFLSSDTLPKVLDLEEVVVIDQAEMIRREESNAIELVKQDFIRENRGGSLMKSLERVPGISMIGIGSGAAKPLIRGLGFNQVMVVENGIKHEGQQWGADHGLEVDQYAADQIRIIKGPASFKYGSDAIGGVIDIREQLPPAKDGVGGSIELGARSNNAWVGGSVNLFARKGKWFGEGRAIVKIRRIGICGTDLHAFEGTQPFFSYPRTLGHELAGEVVEIGESEAISQGDLVTVIPYFSCGSCVACRNGKPNCCQKISVFGVHEDGGMQEYVSLPITSLVKKEGLSLEQFALAEPFAIGAHGVRRAGVKPGQFVLVIGAGPIGLGVMEFARIAGATVIAMDINETRLEFCKDVWNIPHVVKAGATAHEVIQEITNGDFCDSVIDATGSLAAINQGFQYIAHGGNYVLVGLQKGEIAFSHPEFHKREATLMSSRNATREDFDQVLDVMVSGQLSVEKYITHKVKFDQVKDDFKSWLKPETGVIKALVEM